MFMFVKDMRIVQGHMCSCWTWMYAVCKDACVHVKQGCVSCARMWVFMLGKDVRVHVE